MSKDLHTWQHIDALSCELITKLGANDYDAILAVTRGGMIPACLLSERLDVRNVLTAGVMFYTDVGETLNEPRFLQFPSDALLYGKSILIVDDIWDSGKTAMAVKQRVLDWKRAGILKWLYYTSNPEITLFPTNSLTSLLQK